jgi:hypothetical protein
VHWLIEDVVMELLPPGDKERVSYCCWCEKRGIKSWAAVVFKDPSGLNVLTQNVHLAPSTQQAEQAGFTRAKNHKTCQSIFPEN